MNKKQQINASELYVAPEAKIVEVDVQSLLCQSVDTVTIQWFTDDGDELDC